MDLLDKYYCFEKEEGSTTKAQRRELRYKNKKEKERERKAKEKEKTRRNFLHKETKKGRKKKSKKERKKERKTEKGKTEVIRKPLKKRQSIKGIFLFFLF